MPEHAPTFHFHQPKFQGDFEDRFIDRQHRDRDRATTTAQIPPIPDLRFESSFVRSIQRYVRVTRATPVSGTSGKTTPKSEEDYEKVDLDSENGQSVGTDERAGSVTGPSEVIEVQWTKVLWIITKDQVLSPLIQGALWYADSMPPVALQSARFPVISWLMPLSSGPLQGAS